MIILIKKYIFILCAILVLFSSINSVFANDNYIQKALDEVDTKGIDDYMRSNSDYFSDKNITIAQLIRDAVSGKIDFSIAEFFKYQLNKEKDFIKNMVFTAANILLICIVLTIIKYFSEEISNTGVSEIVIFFSVLLVFIIAAKDINFIKDTLKGEFLKFESITHNLNSLFLAAMLTFGKIGLLEFFQTYSKYIISITTKIIYNFTEIMTIILTVIVLINNISKLVNAKLLYKLIKKGTLIILSIYIIVVVINFSVQGYIYYKTDNIFISTVKAISPSSIPMVGNAVNNFFGLFIKSVLLIKDVAGLVIIIFIFSLFGGSLLRLFVIFILYRITAALAEPFNENISSLVQELSDIMYIYFVCMATPVIIMTTYYSIMLSFLNNIYG